MRALVTTLLMLSAASAQASYVDQQLDRLASEMPCNPPRKERLAPGPQACPFATEANRRALITLEKVALANAKKEPLSKVFTTSYLLRQPFVFSGKVVSYDRDNMTEVVTVRLQVAAGRVVRAVSRVAIPADPGSRIEVVGYVAGFEGDEVVLATIQSGDPGDTKKDVAAESH
jgi:hypothetical protein